MNNADTPAAPIELNGFGQYEPVSFLGLTKRERFAMAAMQGLLSGGYNIENSRAKCASLSHDSYCIADAMLDKEKQYE